MNKMMKRLNPWLVGVVLLGLVFWLWLGSCAWRMTHGDRPESARVTVSMDSERVSRGN